MEANQKIIVEDLNPTFLYTWKGTRYEVEEQYHSHDHLEVAFVMSGEGRYFIEDKHYNIAEGDLLIFNPGVRHQALYAKEAVIPSTEFFVGFCDIEFGGYGKNYLPVPNGDYILHTKGELRQKLFKLCSSMEAEKAIRREGRYFMLKAYLMQLLLLVIREQCESVPVMGSYAFEPTNKKTVVEQMLNYFEDHYSEKISLDQIAGNMYLSPFYISRIFKSETGDTPIRHLINIRLEKAMELLQGGYNGSIQEVAALVGYDDAYHFSKLFKKHYGITPSQAKKA